MTTCGLVRAKNEEDILELTLRHLASQVDEIYVADNLSTDGTKDILHRLSSELPLVVFQDEEFANYGGRIVTLMAGEAYTRGHRWAVACDADEFWFGHTRVGDMIEDVRNADAITAVLYDHVPTTDDSFELNPVARMRWRERDPMSQTFGRFAFRLRPDMVVAQGNHDVVPFPKRVVSGLEIRHFPYRSLDQFIRKARNGKAVYDATDLADCYGVTWKKHGLIAEQGEEALVRYYNTTILRTSADPTLVFDPCVL